MIISEQWLRERVTLDLSVQEIADCLTNAGLEVDGVQPLAGQIDNLIIGEVTDVVKHPDADRLSLTQVNVGDGENETLQIVCGAANVRAGLKVAVATVGAKLPNGLKIKRAKVRGVESNGMLCSAAELGLEESSDGILELDSNAVVGQRVDEYLLLNDALIDIDLTPNRGDCLSVAGIARELKFLADGELNSLESSPIETTVNAEIDIDLVDSQSCPRYLGRVIRGISSQSRTPIWMAERLRRCGIRPISPVVDITNYVMLELGQPMHAFDLAKLDTGIVVRRAKQGERLKLLDESDAVLDEQTLVIADHSSAIAIAGVMGGADSAIGDDTQDIVLEAAHFTRKSAAGTARRYGLHTESSQRFERGVDPQLPAQAMERATQLVLQICGGNAGPICEAADSEGLQKKPAVELRLTRLKSLLGMELERKEVARILKRIAVAVQDTTTGWQVTPPSYRFDIEYEADLVEEVARVKGYQNIPTAIPRIAPRSTAGSEQSVSVRQVRQTLVTRDFHEVITYSFISESEQARFSNETPVKLSNPLADNLAVMRSSLLPGLIGAAQFNHNRQRTRLRLFEIGASYHRADAEESGANSGFRETLRLAGLISGPRHDAQWGYNGEKAVDFFDAKADIQSVLSLTGKKEAFIFNEFEHIALHPGQVCSISTGDREVGYLGRLHPNLIKEYDFGSPVFVFEIDLELAMQAELPAYAGVSKFPSVKRDLSVVVDENLPVSMLLASVRSALGCNMIKSSVFDVYQGRGIEKGYKSVSMSVILRNNERTLTDEESENLMQCVIEKLATEHNAELRK